MISSRVRIHRVNLHPLRPLPVAQNFEVSRVVLRISLESERGHRVVDVSPLPGLHAESLEDCLESAKDYFEGIEASLPPSLDAALGFLSLEGLSESPRSGRWENSALLSLDQPSPVSPEARVCKIKIGRAGLQAAERAMRALLREREDREFRLDCNQILRSESLSDIQRLIKNFPIHYIEEPFRDIDQLKAIARELPIALDENLGRDPVLDALAKAWVIKPNVQGFARTRALLQDKSPVLKILSNSFESDASLQLYAYFYRSWVDHPQALGFGTAFYFPAAEREWVPRIYSGSWPVKAFSAVDVEGELLWQN